MNWLNAIVDEVVRRHPDGELVVSSGVSPSGTYHLGTLREILTAEVTMRALRRRGRQVRHLHVVDDLDVFRKIPEGVPASYEKYLGKPLCDVPAPDGSNNSYADYYLNDLLEAAKSLKLDVEIIRAHEKYRSGFFATAIESALGSVEEIKKAISEISGRELDDQWSPVQVIEDGYLKNRAFESIDTDKKEIIYLDNNGKKQSKNYQNGEVKLNWRIDWPARWSLLGVNVEPFGRDHATKGGSYDTGVAIVRNVFKAEPPVPVPYNFINKTGDTKKMSKSSGDTFTASELLKILPAEVVWFFILRASPDKLLFFDDSDTLIRLFDEFGELLAKTDKTIEEKQLVDLCLEGIDSKTVGRVPFSHLVASYQAALKDPHRTLEVITRTEHAETVKTDRDVIINELQFIDVWLNNSAPDDVKFKLSNSSDISKLTDVQKQFLSKLAEKVRSAPNDADGEWFHKAIYDLKDTSGLEPKELFATLYRVLINKDAGPRAGWFLSILPRDWLVDRLELKN